MDASLRWHDGLGGASIQPLMMAIRSRVAPHPLPLGPKRIPLYAAPPQVASRNIRFCQIRPRAGGSAAPAASVRRTVRPDYPLNRSLRRAHSSGRQVRL